MLIEKNKRNNTLRYIAIIVFLVAMKPKILLLIDGIQNTNQARILNNSIFVTIFLCAIISLLLSINKRSGVNA